MLMCIFNVIHKFQITSSNLLSTKLGHWVKPRNMIWFSKFLLTKFDKDGWVEIFCMRKCRNLNLGLGAKARVCKRLGQERDPGMWERCENELSHSQVNSHVENWSPGGLSKFQRLIARVKTPCLEEFFISLESYWNVDVQNGFAWPIRTSTTRVMAKRKAESQTGNLTPNHGKLGIDPIPLRASLGLQLRFRPKGYNFGSDLIPIGGLHKKL